MSKVGYIQYTAIMTAIFFVSVFYNACSEDASFTGASNNVNNEFFGIVDETTEEAAPGTPTIVINNNAEFTKELDVNLTLDPGNAADEMFVSDSADCSMGSWEPYQKNKSWKLSEQNREVSVYVKYRLDGDDETVCAKDSIVHDNIAPTVNFITQLDEWITQRNLNILFDAQDAGSGVAGTDCIRQVGGSFEPCGKIQSYTSLVENQDYLLVIRARDRAGNVSEPKQMSWRSDRTAPVVVFNLTPAVITADVTPDFAFNAIDEGSGVKKYECNVDNGGYSDCQSNLTLSNLSDGSHSLSVRAVDNVGLVSDPISHSWVQDSQAPTIQFTETPNSISSQANARFAFGGINANQNIVSYQCQLDGGAYASCSSPKDLANLGEGSHSFSVVGTDGAGNQSSPISYSWSIDLTAPTLSIIESPDSVTSSTSVRFGLSASDGAGSGIDRLECQLDGGGYVACGSLQDYANLSQGSHTFNARAYDNAGNVSAVASYSWLIDNSLPSVMITSTPTDPTMATDATFEFVANDVGGSGIDRVECRIDGADFVSCNSPASYSNLGNGSHNFYVRAFDNAGNMSAVQSFQWLVDLEAPVVAFVTAPDGAVFIGTDAKIHFISNDGNGSGVASHSCLLDGQTVACDSGTDILVPAAVETTHVFSVTVTDNVGNSTSAEISWLVTQETIPKLSIFDINGDRPVDILFVVDNSGSMDTERSNLAQRIDGFLDKIIGLDWQIGIISTDFNSKKNYHDGDFVDLIGLPGQYIITPSTPGGQQIFGDTVQGFPEGGGNEQGIRASYRAIERSLDPENRAEDEPNRQFFRNGADLAIVVLSDEDENSNGTNIKYTPQDFVDYVNVAWGVPKNLTFHSIIVKPGDWFCKNAEPYHKYGYVYKELSELTGAGQVGGSIIGSVCEQNYTNQLADIGQSVKDQQKSAILECAPVDTDLDGQVDVHVRHKPPGSQDFVDFTEPYVVQGLKVIFDDFLPEGDYRINYSCSAQ